MVTSTTEHWFQEHKQLPEAISRLRRALGQKAKEEPKFRFYTLYGHITRQDTLESAWRLVRANAGGPGIDGVRFADIESSSEGVEGFLSRLREDLVTKEYRPSPVLRVFIEKRGGGQRPLGIPTVRDRVAQMAMLLIIEPIFEVDFHDSSYGFRPGRSAHDALGAVRTHISQGFQAVYDADLRACFDTIPHEKLLSCLERRISDRHVLALIRRWLKAPVAEAQRGTRGKTARKKQTGTPPHYRLSRSTCGTPQGGVLSPLLANVFLHWFDELFHRKEGPGVFANAKLVRYADDFVICARYIGTKLLAWVERTVEEWMTLEINREKTRMVDLGTAGAHLDFLGYTFRYDRDLHGRAQRYLNVTPSKKAVVRERETLRSMTSSARCHQPLPSLIKDVNRHLTGWRQYFQYGYPAMAFRSVNTYIRMRLSRHMDRRSQRPWRKHGEISKHAYLESLGLVYLKSK